MRLCSFDKDGQNRVGIQLESGCVADLTCAYTAFLNAKGHPKAAEIAAVITPPTMIGLIESGDYGLAAAQEAKEYAQGEGAEHCAAFTYAPNEIHFQAPVPHPEKLCAVVQNTTPVLSDPETKKPDILTPLYGFTPASAICGPYDNVEIPSDSGIVGSEAELAVIFSKKARYVEPEDAMDYVYGYTIHNDVSGLEIQDKFEWIHNAGDIKRVYAGQCKTMDNWSPMGPWLYTKDEVPDPDHLELWARVDDVVIQHGYTENMYHKIPDIISYLTYGHTFLPGDIMSWGNIYSRVDGMTGYSADLLGRGGTLITEIAGLGKIENPIVPVEKLYIHPKKNFKTE